VVLFIGIGSTEGPSIKNFSDQLTKAGIKNVYFESAGHGPRVVDVAPMSKRFRSPSFQISGCLIATLDEDGDGFVLLNCRSRFVIE
jgi:hypothetical protein